MPARSPRTSVIPALCIDDLGPGPHRDPHVRRRQRRRVVHAIARPSPPPVRPAAAPGSIALLVVRASRRHAPPRCRAARATASAVVRLSPGEHDDADAGFSCSPAMAAGVVAFIGSDTAMHASQACPSTATNSAVAPSCPHAPPPAPPARPTRRRPPRISAGVAQRDRMPVDLSRSRPCPVTDANPVASRHRARPPPRAAATTAAASGCSLDRSSPAAKPSSAASDQTSSPRPTSRHLAGLPSVSVPVLSTTSVSTALKALQRLGRLDQHSHHRRPCRPPPRSTSASPAPARKDRR